jgi:hypothetical protein
MLVPMGSKVGQLHTDSGTQSMAGATVYAMDDQHLSVSSGPLGPAMLFQLEAFSAGFHTFMIPSPPYGFVRRSYSCGGPH